MSIEELKQKFDAACTELANDAQTVVETHFFITAYMKMFNESLSTKNIEIFSIEHKRETIIKFSA